MPTVATKALSKYSKSVICPILIPKPKKMNLSQSKQIISYVSIQVHKNNTNMNIKN